MNCPHCNNTLRKVEVSVHGARKKATSYQCESCDYFTFERQSSSEVLKELRDTPLKIKQKIVKLSQDRLGIYLNRHVVESLDLKKSQEIYVSVPDKHHILLEIK